jgi:hypothetical protein
MPDTSESMWSSPFSLVGVGRRREHRAARREGLSVFFRQLQGSDPPNVLTGRVHLRSGSPDVVASLVAVLDRHGHRSPSLESRHDCT